MTSRERLLAVLRHGETDRVPWAPQTTRTFFLAIGEYERRFRSEDLPGPIDHYLVPEELAFRVAWYRERGMDFIDWLPPAISCHSSRVQIRERLDGPRRYREIETPVGSLTSVDEYHEEAKTSHPLSYLVKGVQDFRAYEYLMEDERYEDRHAEMAERLRIIGDGGVALVGGPNSPLQHFVLGDLGIEGTIYAVTDHRSAFERLLGVVHRRNLEACRRMLQGPGEVFITGNVTGTGMISPWIYRELAQPFVAEYVTLIHGAGRIAVSHASGEPVSAILADILATGVDALHGTALPRGLDPATFAEAWGGRIAAWGGLDPAFLAAAGPREAAAEAERLIATWAGTVPLILGSTDDCVPGTREENFSAVSASVAARQPRREGGHRGSRS